MACKSKSPIAALGNVGQIRDRLADEFLLSKVRFFGSASLFLARKESRMQVCCLARQFEMLFDEGPRRWFQLSK